MLTKSLDVQEDHSYVAEESFQQGLCVVETVVWMWLQTTITVGYVGLDACSIVNAATVSA